MKSEVILLEMFLHGYRSIMDFFYGPDGKTPHNSALTSEPGRAMFTTAPRRVGLDHFRHLEQRL